MVTPALDCNRRWSFAVLPRLTVAGGASPALLSLEPISFSRNHHFETNVRKFYSVGGNGSGCIAPLCGKFNSESLAQKNRAAAHRLITRAGICFSLIIPNEPVHQNRRVDLASNLLKGLSTTDFRWDEHGMSFRTAQRRMKTAAEVDYSAAARASGRRS